jgi:opacity protein-like surface antigen
VGSPQADFRSTFVTSTGFLLWRSLWVKARFGAVELTGGYQKFHTGGPRRASLFVYPFAANLVARAPGTTLRPYATIGAGAYGWEARFPTSLPDTQGVTAGWSFGASAGLGLEYYLRPRLALDLSVRYHDAASPGARAGLSGDRLRFYTVQLGHYARF